MTRRAQLATPYEERYQQTIQKELEAFERLENEFNAQERKERAAAAKLGLALVLLPSITDD